MTDEVGLIMQEINIDKIIYNFINRVANAYLHYCEKQYELYIKQQGENNGNNKEETNS